MPIKKDCSAEIIEKVAVIEEQCDAWGANCALFRREWNLAAWYALTACARELEQGIPPHERGGSKHQTAATNLSRATYQLYIEAKQRGFKRLAGRSRMHWTLPESIVANALKQAFSYSLCCADFPAWHNNLYSVKSLAGTSIAFDSDAKPRAQQVMAYEKGYRPAKLRSRPTKPKMLIDADQELLDILNTVQGRMTARGNFGFVLPDIEQLHRKLNDLFVQKIARTFRRSVDIQLGGYTMAEYQTFHAAFLSLTSAREYLCFVWKQMGHPLPYDELVILNSSNDWVDGITKLTKLARKSVEQIVSDLTLGEDAWNCDINICPFIPLDDSGHWLAVVPGIVLITNTEECILRNRAARNKHFADIASTGKEEETREDLRNEFPQLDIQGPFKLLKGMPDVDVVIEDKKEDCVLLSELKWLQLPLFVGVRDKRTKEILKGINQIEFIYNFLSANPDFFFKRGKMSKPLNEFKGVHYCVLCRDYIVDITDGTIPLYSYTAFKTSLEDGASLSETIAYMDSDEWLPKHSIDFIHQAQPYECNGITITTDMLIPLYGKQLNLIE
jgi:hypothetical protein